MATKEEIFEDLRFFMEFVIEWHDDLSCLASVEEAIKIAKKYNLNLDVSRIDLNGCQLSENARNYIRDRGDE